MMKAVVNPINDVRPYQEQWDEWCREHDAAAMLLGGMFGRISFTYSFHVGRMLQRYIDPDTLEPLPLHEQGERMRESYGVKVFQQRRLGR
jgi:hypothetical protein